MADKAMLFYEQATPISVQRHKDWSVRSGADYAFSRGTNSVPLTAVEFPRASREYPIVFTGDKDATLPLAVLGIEDRNNLRITEDGGWSGDYIPAFVRRYPFVFATNDSQNFTVCLDEGFAGCNQDGDGERLFDDAGERTPYLDRVVNFLTEYQRHYHRTKLFGDRLRELDLLEPVQANVSLNTGRKVSLTGFNVVSRDPKALGGEELTKLAQNDDLELVYVHLQSMANFGSMVDRLAASGEDAKA